MIIISGVIIINIVPMIMIIITAMIVIVMLAIFRTCLGSRFLSSFSGLLSRGQSIALGLAPIRCQ